jgi:branched-subunit amino acid ABC-type transport system permease component
VQVIPAVQVLLVQRVIQARLEVALLRAIPVMLVVLGLTALLVTRALLETVQQQETPEMLEALEQTVMLEPLALMERALQEADLETPARQVMQAAQPLRQPLQILQQTSHIAQHWHTL